MIRASRGKEVLSSILTLQRCRYHLKLRSLFTLSNVASVRNISIMGKTCKSPCPINAKGNRCRSLRRRSGRILEGSCAEVACCRGRFAKLFICCRKTTESRYLVLEKFLIKILVIVNRAGIYVLSTARHY